jgi:hypothetical protein
MFEPVSDHTFYAATTAVVKAHAVKKSESSFL